MSCCRATPSNSTVKLKKETTMEQASVKVTIIPNGPAKVECAKAEVHFPDGSIVVKENKFSLCRCGQSAGKPFCDGTHKTCGFVG